MYDCKPVFPKDEQDRALSLEKIGHYGTNWKRLGPLQEFEEMHSYFTSLLSIDDLPTTNPCGKLRPGDILLACCNLSICEQRALSYKIRLDEPSLLQDEVDSGGTRIKRAWGSSGCGNPRSFQRFESHGLTQPHSRPLEARWDGLLEPLEWE